jgi:hypothetical protein
MQYTDGVAAVTNGSAVVAGTGTLWLANVSVGDILKLSIDGDATYVVGSVDSDTQITLSSNYAGSTVSGQSYVIQRDFSVNRSYALPNMGDAGSMDFLREQTFNKIDTDMGALYSGMIGNISDPLVHIPMRRAADALRLSGSETFTRSTTGTYIDSQDSLVKSAAIDTPRYERMVDDSIGILIEGPSENKLIYSEEINNGIWSKMSCSTVTNSTDAPDDTTTAEKIVEDGSDGKHHVNQLPAAITDNAPAAGSVYLKQGERAWARLTIRTKDFATADAWFDLANGVIGTVDDGFTASMTPVANGFYRCAVEVPDMGSSSGVVTFWIYMATADEEVSYQGDGSSGIYAWGAQMEELPFASSYIPTTASTVARTADNYSVAFIDNIIEPNKPETWLIDVDMLGKQGSADVQTVISIEGETHRRLRANEGSGEWSVFYGNSNSTTSAALSGRTKYRLGMVHNETNFNLWQDGTRKAQQAATSVTGSGTSIALGNNGSADYLFGHLRNLRFYDKALNDLEMQAA